MMNTHRSFAGARRAFGFFRSTIHHKSSTTTLSDSDPEDGSDFDVYHDAPSERFSSTFGASSRKPMAFHTEPNTTLPMIDCHKDPFGDSFLASWSNIHTSSDERNLSPTEVAQLDEMVQDLTFGVEPGAAAIEWCGAMFCKLNRSTLMRYGFTTELLAGTRGGSSDKEGSTTKDHYRLLQELYVQKQFSRLFSWFHRMHCGITQDSFGPLSSPYAALRLWCQMDHENGSGSRLNPNEVYDIEELDISEILPYMLMIIDQIILRMPEAWQDTSMADLLVYNAIYGRKIIITPENTTNNAELDKALITVSGVLSLGMQILTERLTGHKKGISTVDNRVVYLSQLRSVAEWVGTMISGYHYATVNPTVETVSISNGPNRFRFHDIRVSSRPSSFITKPRIGSLSGSRGQNELTVIEFTIPNRMAIKECSLYMKATGFLNRKGCTGLLSVSIPEKTLKAKIVLRANTYGGSRRITLDSIEVDIVRGSKIDWKILTDAHDSYRFQKERAKVAAEVRRMACELIAVNYRCIVGEILKSINMSVGGATGGVDESMLGNGKEQFSTTENIELMIDANRQVLETFTYDRDPDWLVENSWMNEDAMARLRVKVGSLETRNKLKVVR